MDSALPPIAWVVVGYSLLVAIAAAVGLALKAPRPGWLMQLVGMCEVLGAVLALAGVGWLSQGNVPDSRSTYIGYLCAVVLIIPVAWSSVRADRSQWGSGVLMVTCLGEAVLAWRIVVLS